MKKYDEMTSGEISEMPFIEMPFIALNLGIVEPVSDIAIRNRMPMRKCLEVLHALDRSPDFDFTWYDGESYGSVRIELSKKMDEVSDAEKSNKL